MRGFVLALVGLLGFKIALVLVLIGFLAVSAGLFTDETQQGGGHDIPPELVPVYKEAAQARCEDTPWTVLAAIGSVESDHGRNGGGKLRDDGLVEPRIIGPPLDGGPGVQAISDTDNGRWDDDARWDRAVGPMQFIPDTWRSVGVDASGSGEANPHNAADAIHTAARYLCDAEGSRSVRDRVYAYNHADWYVDKVMTIAAGYRDTGPILAAGEQIADGDYALPVGLGQLTAALLDQPHHDYPAWDLGLTRGTPIGAVHAGRVVSVSREGRCGRGVTIAGNDGARYTYCHGEAVAVDVGDDVEAGQHILDAGSTGRSTGPHLHLQIKVDGALVCPQPLLAAWHDGQPAGPSEAPRKGCVA